MKHTAMDLAQMMALPLSAKIEMSQQRIRQWYEAWDGLVYVSFSGGKDSTVLLHLVRDLYTDVEAVYVDTGLEYPELREHVKSFENVTWLKPKMSFKEVIKRYGYPFPSKEVSKDIYYAKKGSFWALKRANDTKYNKGGKLSRYGIGKWKILMDAPFDVSSYCCDIMKKSPLSMYERMTNNKCFVGTMACESQRRFNSWLQTGCNGFDAKKPISKPLSFWTEQDVLEYILKFNLTIPSVYGDIVETEKEIKRVDGMHKELRLTGRHRTGCMFCMFGCHLEKSPNRFEQMKETHPKVYDYCMKPTEDGGLGIKQVIDWINENGNMNIKY